MPTLDELRKRFSSNPDAPAANPTAKDVVGAAKAVGAAAAGAVLWTADQIKRWAPKFDVISSGVAAATGGAMNVTDLRFKFGKNAGKTMREMAAGSGSGRGYLRWFYCETGMDECVRNVIQVALAEDHDTITSKYNAVEKGAK